VACEGGELDSLLAQAAAAATKKKPTKSLKAA
jgi:hypothetical protein